MQEVMAEVFSNIVSLAVGGDGAAGTVDASYSYGVRPYFLLR